MKINDLLLIGGLAVGAYLLYKMLSGGSLFGEAFAGGGGGGGGGGYIQDYMGVDTGRTGNAGQSNTPVVTPGPLANISIAGKTTYTNIPLGVAKASIPVLNKALGQISTMKAGQPRAPIAPSVAPKDFAKTQIQAMKTNQLLTFMSKYGGK